MKNNVTGYLSIAFFILAIIGRNIDFSIQQIVTFSIVSLMFSAAQFSSLCKKITKKDDLFEIIKRNSNRLDMLADVLKNEVAKTKNRFDEKPNCLQIMFELVAVIILLCGLTFDIPFLQNENLSNMFSLLSMSLVFGGMWLNERKRMYNEENREVLLLDLNTALASELLNDILNKKPQEETNND